ncbi:TetR family transcriptional regulator [Streptomyces sp. NPDC088915]|uniref:TetR family transcriptional regulator n=1 Tax=Streptomyces sp. NPDC088915 TaxID=3365912 RepID=UPI00382CAF1C
MAIQQRAERTRQEILSAAARVFDRLGYERASLARIAGDARVTTGALVFHFATKADLAVAVRARSRAVTGVTVESACLSTEGVGGTAVDKLVITTHALIRLFETDPVARAGERLARELQPTDPASSRDCPWRREVSRLARYAVAEKALRPGVDATAVATLIGYVVTGVELEMRCPCPPADALRLLGDGGPQGPCVPESGALHGSAEERLRRIWELILPGLVHPAAQPPQDPAAPARKPGPTSTPAPLAPGQTSYGSAPPPAPHPQGPLPQGPRTQGPRTATPGPRAQAPHAPAVPGLHPPTPRTAAPGPRPQGQAPHPTPGPTPPPRPAPHASRPMPA